MADERKFLMSCGDEVPENEVRDHYHDDESELTQEENERHYLKAVSVGALSAAGLTAVAFGLARRRLNSKGQE